MSEAAMRMPRGLTAIRLGRHRGLLIAIAVLIALILINNLMSATPMSYFEVSFLSSGGATLAIAAAGQTIVVLSGGFDLSAGAVISLVNVILSTWMQDAPASMLAWSIAGVGVGVLTGAFNGFFISAQQGAGDPLAGNPMLLQMFAAVVVGGTALGGGRGGPTGSIIGAYVLMIVVNILLVFNVSAYYSTIAEGLILLLAVLAG